MTRRSYYRETLAAERGEADGRTLADAADDAALLDAIDRWGEKASKALADAADPLDYAYTEGFYRMLTAEAFDRGASLDTVEKFLDLPPYLPE